MSSIDLNKKDNTEVDPSAEGNSLDQIKILLREREPKLEELLTEAMKHERANQKRKDAKVLEIDFIFAQVGDVQMGFRELIVALANAPHESLFSTELVITLVDHFWNRYYRYIFTYCFIPFLIYFILTIVYLSKWTVHGIPEDE